MKCPVCKNQYHENSRFCNACGFNELQTEFVNKDELNCWVENIVNPYRDDFLRNLEFSAEEDGSLCKKWNATSEFGVSALNKSRNEMVWLPREFFRDLPLYCIPIEVLSNNLKYICLCVNKILMHVGQSYYFNEAHDKWEKYFCISFSRLTSQGSPEVEYEFKINKESFLICAYAIFEKNDNNNSIRNWKRDDFDVYSVFNKFFTGTVLNPKEKEIFDLAYQPDSNFMLHLDFEDFGDYQFDGVRTRQFNESIEKFIGVIRNFKKGILLKSYLEEMGL